MGPKSGGNYAGARGPKFWAKMAKNRERAHGFCPNFAFSGRQEILGRHCSSVAFVNRRRRRKSIPRSGSRFMANLPNAQGGPFFGQKGPKFAFSGRRGICGWYCRCWWELATGENGSQISPLCQPLRFCRELASFRSHHTSLCARVSLMKRRLCCLCARHLDFGES